MSALALSPEGRFAAVGTIGGAILVWDLRRETSPPLFGTTTGRVYEIAFTADSLRLLAATDTVCTVWHLESGAEERAFTGKSWPFAVAPDAHTIVSAGPDFDLQAWDLHTGETRLTLPGSKGAHFVFITPDGCQAVAAPSTWDPKPSGAIKVWDLSTGAELQSRTAWALSIKGVARMPGGRLAVLDVLHGDLKIWDLGSGEELLMCENGVSVAAMTPNCRRAVSNSLAGTLKVWDLTARRTCAVKAHNRLVEALAVSPAGALVASTSFDDTKVWDLRTCRALRTTPSGDWAGCVAMSGDGRLAVGRNYPSGVITLYDLVAGESYTLRDGPEEHVMAVAMTPDGSRAVGSLLEGGLVVCDLLSPRTQYFHDSPGDTSMDIAVTPDGGLALTSHAEGVLRVWDLGSGRVRCKCTHERSHFPKVAVAAVGLGVSCSGVSEVLKVWNLADGTEVAALGQGLPWESVSAAAMTPDGRWAVTSALGGTIRLWDLHSRKLVASFLGDNSILCCAVSHDGETIVAGDTMGHLHFLRVEGVRETVSATDTSSQVTDKGHEAIARLRHEAEESHAPILDHALLSGWVCWKRSLLEDELERQRIRCGQLKGVRSRQCQGFPRNPGRFHPESGLSPSLDQLGAIEREASFL